MVELKLDTIFLNNEIKSKYNDYDLDLPIPANMVVKYFEPFIRNYVECPILHPQLSYRVKYNYELWKKELLTEYSSDLTDIIGFETKKKVVDLENRFKRLPSDYINNSTADKELFEKLSLFTALAENINRGFTRSKQTEWQKELLLFKDEVGRISEALRPFIGDENKVSSFLKESIAIVSDGLPVSALRFSLFSQKDTKIKSRIFRLKFYQFLRSIVLSIDTSKNDWVKDYFHQEGSERLSDEDLKFIENGVPKGRPDSTEAIREFCYCINRYLNSNDAKIQFWNSTPRKDKTISNITVNKFIYLFLESTRLVEESNSEHKLIEGYINKYKKEHSI